MRYVWLAIVLMLASDTVPVCGQLYPLPQPPNGPPPCITQIEVRGGVPRLCTTCYGPYGPTTFCT